MLVAHTYRSQSKIPLFAVVVLEYMKQAKEILPIEVFDEFIKTLQQYDQKIETPEKLYFRICEVVFLFMIAFCRFEFIRCWLYFQATANIIMYDTVFPIIAE